MAGGKVPVTVPLFDIEEEFSVPLVAKEVMDAVAGCEVVPPPLKRKSR
jgi:hypothetical protein